MFESMVALVQLPSTILQGGRYNSKYSLIYPLTCPLESSDLEQLYKSQIVCGLMFYRKQ